MKRRLSMLMAVTAYVSSVAFAQAAPPAFDVASVRPAAPLTMQDGEPKATLSHVRIRPGNVDMRNIGMTEAIAWAYDLDWYQILGPSWLPETHFDIAAKVDRPATDDEMRLMTQTLLASRFALREHREDKELDCMALVVGKDGAKLKPSEDQRESTFEPVPKKMAIKMGHMSMRLIARILSEMMQKPVVDLTGIKGTFDFTLDASNYAPPPYAPGQGHDEPDQVYMVTRALQEQLGLRLENRKLSVNVLVVDHAEKAPTEN